jgi:hypothetical protein
MNASLAAFVLLVTVAGCATPFRDRPTDEQIAEASASGAFGAPPDKYEAAINEWLRLSLKDPDSVKSLKISPPMKGWSFEAGALLVNERKDWGWVCFVEYNAKNSYGGYVGLKSYRYFFKDGAIKATSTRSTSGENGIIGIATVAEFQGGSATGN